MSRKKEVSKLELEAKRMKRSEKRFLNPDNNPNSPIMELSDESLSPIHSESMRSKLAEFKHSPEGDKNLRDRFLDRHSFSSSESNCDDEDDFNESNKGTDNSNDGSNYNNPSLLSVDRLAKYDQSDGDSPGHVNFNNLAKNERERKEKRGTRTVTLFTSYSRL